VPHPVIDWHVVGVDEDGDPYTVANPFPVSIQGSVSIGTVDAEPVSKSLTDLSGTITTGGAAQTLDAADAARTFFYFQNGSDEEMRVPPFGTWESADVCPTGAISLFAATTGKRFEAYKAQ
jgi:hypothetical protein